MNSLEIWHYLSQIPAHTVGVYPSDTIPESWQKPTAFVFNTDSSKRPGGHWTAVYVDQNSNECYFDSYGLAPFIPNHVNRLRKNCKTLKFNDRQLQSESSAVCGHFCPMFLHYMSCDLGLQRFLDIFTRDLRRNDLIAEEFVENLSQQKKKQKNNRAFELIVNGQRHLSLFSQNCRPKTIQRE